jgi:hypothetical protein
MSLGEKAKELREQRKEVFSLINRQNIAYRRIVKVIITIVALVVIYLNWSFLVSHLATFLTKGTNIIQDTAQAPIVANYLLLILIIATVGVESFPFLEIGGIGQDSALTVSPTR